MIRALLAVLAAAILLSAPRTADAAACRNEDVAGKSYTICDVDPRAERLRLFLYKSDGQPFGYFGPLDGALKEKGETLGFAMNAGMYHENRAPVGYYVQDGREVQGVISSDGPGNFGLLPNGILCLREGRADVIETLRFLREKPACREATQSGPMLVIDGALHPRFLKNSTSRYVRNGVGTSADGTRAVFVISNDVVTFHEFGSLFQKHLGLPNALYFDGNVSRLRAPDLGRDDLGFSALGPIIGVVESAE